MVEFTPTERAYAERAHALITRDPSLFNGVFNQLETQVMEAWKQAPTPEQREAAWSLIKASQALQDILHGHKTVHDAILTTQGMIENG